MPEGRHIDTLQFSKNVIRREPSTWLPGDPTPRYGVDLGAGREFDKLTDDLKCPPPPKPSELSGEALEVMWMALLRALPFTSHETDVLVREAEAEMSEWGVEDLFRPNEMATWSGDYVSRLLKMPIPDGDAVITIPRHVSNPRGTVFGTTIEDTHAMHEGDIRDHVGSQLERPPVPISYSGSTLGSVVRADYALKFCIAASLILDDLGVPTQFDDGKDKRFIDGGINHLHEIFGISHREALRTAWANKMQFKQARPETWWAVFNQWANGHQGWHGFDEKLKNTQAVRICIDRFGSRCLPLMYPEGAPGHPSYPAGHATVSGVCSTILKMWYKDGPWPGDTRREHDTIHGEIDKMGFNVSTGRSWAGVHFRSDNINGLRSGEALAIDSYAKWVNGDNMSGVFQTEAHFTKFDGTKTRLDLYADPIDTYVSTDDECNETGEES